MAYGFADKGISVDNFFTNILKNTDIPDLKNNTNNNPEKNINLLQDSYDVTNLKNKLNIYLENISKIIEEENYFNKMSKVSINKQIYHKEKKVSIDKMNKTNSKVLILHDNHEKRDFIKTIKFKDEKKEHGSFVNDKSKFIKENCYKVEDEN